MEVTRIAMMALCAAVVAACSNGDAPRDARIAVRPQLPAPDTLPRHAVTYHEDSVTGLLKCHIGYNSTTVWAMQEHVVGTPIAKLTASSAWLQGVAVGQDSVGSAYVIVVAVNYNTDTSTLETFRDATADGLPDQSTRANIATVSNAHFVQPKLDVSTGTLYVYDGLNDRIVRFPDGNADKVPDGTASTTFRPGPLGSTGLEEPTANSVRVYHDAAMRGIHPYLHLLLTDSDGDGVADSQTEEGNLGEETRDEFGNIVGNVYAGLTKLQVRVFDTATWRIEESASTPPEVLATFTGTTTEQEVTLSRALAEGDNISIVKSASGKSFEGIKVAAATELFVSHFEDIIGTPKEGDSVTIVGTNIAGNETVEASIRDGDDTWSAATITSSTSTTLVITIPDLGITEREIVVFRVTNSAGRDLRLVKLVEAGP